MAINKKIVKKRLGLINGVVSQNGLSTPAEKTAGPNGVLARLYMNILNDLGIRWMRLEHLINAYVLDPRNGVSNNRKDMTTMKGNLVKDLTKSQMSWNVLMRGLKILEFTEIEVKITATHSDGSKTTHGLTSEQPANVIASSIPDSNSVLARLFMNVLNDLGIRWVRLEHLINAYVLDSRNGVPNNRKDMTTMKGNLVKSLTKPQMTWKVLMRGFRILEFTQIAIDIIATHPCGKKTVHGTIVELGNQKEAKEFNRRLNQSEESELKHESTTNI